LRSGLVTAENGDKIYLLKFYLSDTRYQKEREKAGGVPFLNRFRKEKIERRLGVQSSLLKKTRPFWRKSTLRTNPET